jgi:tRNA A37 threonylcarbamoyladenosine synthetase subunit TsaC/SUA5/YrdC
MLRVTVEPSGQDFWKLDPVVDLINSGAVGVIPTDTVYDMSILSLHFSLCSVSRDCEVAAIFTLRTAFRVAVDACECRVS